MFYHRILSLRAPFVHKRGAIVTTECEATNSEHKNIHFWYMVQSTVLLLLQGLLIFLVLFSSNRGRGEFQFQQHHIRVRPFKKQMTSRNLKHMRVMWSIFLIWVVCGFNISSWHAFVHLCIVSPSLINMSSIFHSFQWRIQDFPEGGAPTAKVGAPTYYFRQFSPKTAWNWRNLDRKGGGARPWRPPSIRQCIFKNLKWSAETVKWLKKIFDL